MAEAKTNKQEKKKEKQKPNVSQAGEKIYTIRLAEAYKKALNRRSPYAVRLVKGYVKTHTKAKEVKIGSKLNEAIWQRGIKKPARSVRVKIARDGDTAKVELMGFDYKDFKAKPKKERQGMKEKLLERLGPKALKKEEEEKKIEGEAKAEEKLAGDAQKAEQLVKEEAKPAEAKGETSKEAAAQ